MRELFGAWADFRGRGQSEDAKIMRAVSTFIDRHAARFANIDGTDGAAVHDRAGWYRAHGDGRLTKRVRVKGEGIARVYVVNPAALLAALEE
jgi:putative DNA primase/helicase